MRERERELICKRLRGVRRGETEKVTGYWAFLHKKKEKKKKIGYEKGFQYVLKNWHCMLVFVTNR